MDRTQSLSRLFFLGAFQRGDPEIGDLYCAVLQDQDVLGFNIPMDDALCMRMIQRLHDLNGKMKASFQPSAPFFFKYCFKVMPSMSSITMYST
jgi:hypothetical protein